MLKISNTFFLLPSLLLVIISNSLNANNALIPICKREVGLSMSRNMCTSSELLEYRSCFPPTPSLIGETPRLGLNTDNISDQCGYMSHILAEDFVDDAKSKLEKHVTECTGTSCIPTCDQDCNDLYLSELYESYLIRFSLESKDLADEILAIYQKIFKKFGKDSLEASYKKWIAEPALFPVNQKDRDWTNYKKEVALKNIIGVSHDPTNILLSADFLKQLQYELPDEFRAERDYMFNNVLKKARGYRTNSKKGREGRVERLIGITSFDLDDLALKSKYYEIKKWMHPGRSQCDTSPLQGMYQNEAFNKSIPLKCGISGSTNFWIWTALFSGVNLTPEEVRLLVFSAYVVLGADGGHSLMEVLSSATMSSIYMKHYDQYSQERILTPFIRNSNFAKNLYEVTKDINPIGNEQAMCIDFDRVAKDIYSKTRYEAFNDKQRPEEKEISHRKEIEAFFLSENGRFVKPFGDYASFLDKLPQLAKIRKQAMKKVKQYIKNYCIDN